MGLEHSQAEAVLPARGDHLVKVSKRVDKSLLVGAYKPLNHRHKKLA